MMQKAIRLACLATFVYAMASLCLLDATLVEEREVVLDAYNEAANKLDCSDLRDNVVFYKQPKNESDRRMVGPLASVKQPYYNVVTNVLYFTDLKELIDTENYDYCCELLGDEEHIKFKIKIMPRCRAFVETQTITIGGFKDLVCELESGNETSARWEWYKDNKVIEFTNQTRFSLSATRHQSRLSLRDVTDDDKGIYKCMLINSYSNASSEIHVKINSVINVLWPFFICTIVVVGLILFFCFIERRSERKHD